MPVDNHSTVAKPGSRLRELGLATGSGGFVDIGSSSRVRRAPATTLSPAASTASTTLSPNPFPLPFSYRPRARIARPDALSHI